MQFPILVLPPAGFTDENDNLDPLFEVVQPHIITNMTL